MISVRSDPLHDSMLEGMLVVETRNILFTYCGQTLKYWPLKDIRHNLKNTNDKEAHLFKEHGKEVPIRQILSKSRTRFGLDFEEANPLTVITKLEWIEQRNILLVALRDSGLIMVKVFIGTGKFKYHRHRSLGFKVIKQLQTAEVMGLANVKVSKKLLLLGELNERFITIDLRTGQTVLTSTGLNMEDWVQGMCCAMDNNFVACSSIFGSLAIFKVSPPKRKEPMEWSQAYYSQYFLDHKNGQGGIHCMASSNRQDDPIIFIGSRKEVRFAKVSIYLFDLRQMTIVHSIQDDLSLGLFASITVFKKDDHYAIIAKNQDHKPGEASLLRIDLRAELDKEAFKVKDQKLHRFDTVGTGYREGSLYAGIHNGRIEVLNCSRSKVLHYLSLSYTD